MAEQDQILLQGIKNSDKTAFHQLFSDFHDTLATQFYSDSKIIIEKLPMPNNVINYDLKNYTSAVKTDKSK